jgi:serine/threonine protein kinase
MGADRHRVLADLLLDWEDHYTAGTDMPAAELAREHPELIAELDLRIRALKATLWLAKPPGMSMIGAAVCGAGSAEPPLPLAGRYRLDKLIGVGGFAEVWRGFDLQLQRPVAVKIPKASTRRSEALLAEARRVAAFRHPGIVTVHDVGSDANRWFIVSEFMSGGSLASRLAAGRIARGDAVRWVGQVANALDAAHRAGLVHRDVKPENVLITATGDAMLTDFGIARPQGSTDATASGVGTLRFMAPEQLRGEPASPASDIYALGMVLHETLTDRFPFRFDSPNGIRGEIVAGVAGQIASTIPRRLGAVCRKALALNPADRYPTSSNFAEALSHAHRPVTPRLRTVAAVAAALALMAGGIGMLKGTRRNELAKNTTLAVIVPDQPPPMLHADASGHISLRCLKIHDLNPYVITAKNVRIYHEWQDLPITYVGPAVNDIEGRIVYRFDTGRPITAGRLLATVFNSDGTIQPTEVGRGAGAVEVSRDGDTWVSVCNSLQPRRWGEDHAIDEVLPKAVLGATSLWLRVRLLTTGSLKTRYTTAQFGRDFFDDFPVLDGVFGLDLRIE